nr:hypothetical protein [Tanacetum cinerariifolium]
MFTISIIFSRGFDRVTIRKKQEQSVELFNREAGTNILAYLGRCLKEKLSGSNFNDWFRLPKTVTRVEKKLFVIEQSIFPVPPADSKYLRSGMRLMMLIMRLLVLCSEVGHCKRNCPAYIAELIKKKKQVGTVNSSDIFIIELFSFLSKSWAYDIDCGTHICNTKHGLRGVRKLKQVEAIGSDDLVLPNGLVMIRQSERRNRSLLDIVRSAMNLTTLSLSFWDYALESATRILSMVPTKKRDMPKKLHQRSVKCIFIRYPKKTMGYSFYFPPKNTIVVARYAEFLEKKYYISRSFKPPQEEVILVRGSVWTHRAPERLCLNVEVKEHSLGDLNEPTNYKAALLDLKSDKWLNFMNAEMQFMKDN